MAELRRLTSIRAAGSDTYIATLTTDDGREKEYAFTVARGSLPIIQASSEFAEDVGSFGYGHLVPKAVAAFRDSHENPVGRPEGYESRPVQETPTGESQTGDE